MKKLFALAVLALGVGQTWAAGIEGKWQTIDDETGKPKAIIQITQSGGAYTGKIIALSAGVVNKCPGCKNPDSPLVGMNVVQGLKENSAGTYEGGTIFDPKSGKTYKSNAKVTNGGKTLEVRGYIGVSALGRTQKWQRQ